MIKIYEVTEGKRFQNSKSGRTDARPKLIQLRREAQDVLSHYTSDQIDCVKRGYEQFVKEVGDAYVDERESNASQIKNEYAAECIENGIVTSEEFEDIWDALEKLSKFDSYAYA